LDHHIQRWQSRPRAGRALDKRSEQSRDDPFLSSGLVNRDGVSTFMCEGDEGQRSVFACGPIAKTALDLGFITLVDLVHCADR
jgi:hypothetical protein